MIPSEAFLASNQYRTGGALGSASPPGPCRPFTLPGHQVFQAVTINIDVVHGVALREELREQILLQKRGVATILIWLLDVRPDSVTVRGAAEHIVITVTIEIIGKHVGAGIAQVGPVKFPGFVVEGTRLFPPAAGYHHVKPAVLVDVAHSQAMRKGAGFRESHFQVFFCHLPIGMGCFVR